MLAAIVAAALFVIVLVALTPIVTQTAANNRPDGVINVSQSQSEFANPELLIASSEVSGHEANEANDDSNVSYWEALMTTSTSPYDNPAQSNALSLNSTRPLIAEHIDTASSLIDESINEIQVGIRKVGNPSQPVKVGVFHANYTTVQHVTQNGSDTFAVSTSDGEPALSVNTAELTVSVAGGDSFGERANSKQSVLYQYPVTSITGVRLAKTGSPTGNVIIGILDDSTGEPVTTCATVPISSLGSTFANFGGSCTETYVGLGDVVGIYFDGTGTVGGGNYVKVRVSNSTSFDHTSDDVRTSFAEFTGGSWVPDASKDLKQTITGANRIAYSAIDTDLTTYWQNANPSTANSHSTSGILDYSKLVGGNWDDYVLKQKGNQGTRAASSLAFYREHFQLMRDHHLTVIRVPYNWEAYEANPTNFITAAQRIAQVAEEKGMKVFFDFHHFYISGWLDFPDKSESGFPLFVVENYQDQTDCYEDASCGGLDDGEIFWDDFWLNDVNYNGTNVWQDMANFEKTLITAVDDYDSVIGYEILNEPHFWKNEHYDQGHDFYDFMYHELREATDKDIHITRETPHGNSGFTRSPSLEWKIFPDAGPDVYGLVYQPHHYNVNTFPSQLNSVDDIIDDVIAHGHDPEIVNRVIWGEFGMGSPSPACAANGNTPTTDCQNGMNSWISKMEAAGHGWTFWKWNEISGGSHQGRVLIQTDGSNEPTTPYMVLKAMDVSLAAYYDLDELDAVADDSGSSGGSTGGTITDNIFLNFTSPMTVSSVKIKHQHADFVPDTVKLYFSNDTSSWGTAAETASLSANTNNQTITVSPTKYAKFMKVEAGIFSNARFWRVQNIDAGQIPPHPVITESTTLEIVPIKVFGTIQPDILTSSFQNITRSLISESYNLQDGDFVGVTNDDDSGYYEVKTSGDTIGEETTQLVYVGSNETTFDGTKDLSGAFKLTRLADKPEIIVDMGLNATIIDKIVIYKPDITNIPSSVDVYVAHDIDEQTGEPIFIKVLNNHALAQSTGNETLDISNTAGRYVKLAVNAQGDAESIHLGEIDGVLITEIQVQAPDGWAAGYDQIVTSFFAAMAVAVVGLVVYVLKQGIE